MIFQCSFWHWSFTRFQSSWAHKELSHSPRKLSKRFVNKLNYSWFDILNQCIKHNRHFSQRQIYEIQKQSVTALSRNLKFGDSIIFTFVNPQELRRCLLHRFKANLKFIGSFGIRPTPYIFSRSILESKLHQLIIWLID